MMLGPDAPDAFVPLGMYGGYFTIPHSLRPGERYIATAYLATKSRFIMTRRHDPHRTQAYLFCKNEQSLGDSHKTDVDDEKRALAEVFRGAGWRSQSLLESSQTADDFYAI